MENLKNEGKLSNRNKVSVLVCLTIGLLGVAIFHQEFPALKGELSDTLFIAALIVMSIHVFWKKK